ncbi:MAG TPA: FAD-dependent oxidoreductase [Thermoanaerobaculia bacterium]|nr:FAD-dependent oxidoreductase [Thermoanaerobaculia bacterium]
MSRNVIVVGGGICGLAASIYLARNGVTVTLFERERHLGGRATTQLRNGFRFNLGPHRVLRRGAGARIFRELGVPLRGGRPRAAGTALSGGERYRLPVSPLSLTFTRLLSPAAKLEAARLMFRIRRIDPAPFAGITIREWLDANVSDARLRLTFDAVLRAATYSSDPDQSAAPALQQLKLANQGFAYIDEGWQKIVDALHSHSVSAGVNFVTSSQVLRVIYDDSVRAVELGGLQDEPKGTRLAADTVLLAVDPVTAGQIVGNAELSRSWRELRPVTAACLGVALSKLPDRRRPIVVDIDRPLYLAVHSVFAQLTPHGGALVQAVKFGSGDGAEQELESLMDELQPGWRDLVVNRRFLPSTVVSNALATPKTPRPRPATSVRGLYIAGDWVEAEGLLADAALSSAKSAAEAILRTP